MKKISRVLCSFLALAMVLTLAAVPAFALPLMPNPADYFNCSVQPLGTLYSGYSGEQRQSALVFDQTVTLSMKDGLPVVGNPEEGAINNSDGSVTLYISDKECYRLVSETDDGGLRVFDICGKAFADEMVASSGDYYEYVPLNTSTSTNTPSTPSTSTPSTSTSVKPAAGVSVPLNDGSGEFAYTIKSGDTLGRIAAYYYGNVNVYKLIYERNKDILKSANAIYAGQTITLPSYAAVAKGVASIAPSTPSTPTTPSTPSTSTPSASTSVKPAPGVSQSLNDGSGEFAYTIKAGDSLSRIAAYYYGNANVYKLIYERNKDILKNANTIYAGQTIILPSYAAVAQGVAKI